MQFSVVIQFNFQSGNHFNSFCFNAVISAKNQDSNKVDETDFLKKLFPTR